MRWRVELVEPFWFMDSLGNPVEGYRIRFVLEDGTVGYAYISRKGYSLEAAQKAVVEEVTRILEMRSIAAD